MIALMAHGLLIAALTWGTHWHNKNEIVAASAELWRELPVEAAPPLLSEPSLAPEPIVKPPPDEVPDIVLERIKTKAAAKQKAQEDLRLREQMRQDQIKRMAGLVGATGSPSHTGAATQNAAPSSSYAGKVKAKVRPNIVFQNAEALQGDPTVEITIRIAPDGSIVLPLKVIKPSGNAAWDSAVLRGIEKTETLPRDNDGKFPAPFILIWHLKE
jgi:colicin import membrane protein